MHNDASRIQWRKNAVTVGSQAKNEDTFQAGGTRTYDFEYRIGYHLPNGAILLVETVINEETDRAWLSKRESIVLCLAQNQHNPFVTWRRTVGFEQRANGDHELIDYCYSGEYFHLLPDALEGLDLRVVS